MIKAVLILFLAVVRPDGGVEVQAGTVDTCPPQEDVLASFEKRVSEGKIIGFSAFCQPINFYVVEEKGNDS